MRTLLVIAAALAALSFVVVGCSDDGDEPAPAGIEQQAYDVSRASCALDSAAKTAKQLGLPPSAPKSQIADAYAKEASTSSNVQAAKQLGLPPSAPKSQIADVQAASSAGCLAGLTE